MMSCLAEEGAFDITYETDCFAHAIANIWGAAIAGSWIESECHTTVADPASPNCIEECKAEKAAMMATPQDANTTTILAPEDFCDKTCSTVTWASASAAVYAALDIDVTLVETECAASLTANIRDAYTQAVIDKGEGPTGGVCTPPTRVHCISGQQKLTHAFTCAGHCQCHRW
jgi:hypothetical protein